MLVLKKEVFTVSCSLSSTIQGLSFYGFRNKGARYYSVPIIPCLPYRARYTMLCLMYSAIPCLLYHIRYTMLVIPCPIIPRLLYRARYTVFRYIVHRYTLPVIPITMPAIPCPLYAGLLYHAQYAIIVIPCANYFMCISRAKNVL